MGIIQKEGSKEGAASGGRTCSLLRSGAAASFGGFVLLTHGASWPLKDRVLMIIRGEAADSSQYIYIKQMPASRY